MEQDIKKTSRTLQAEQTKKMLLEVAVKLMGKHGYDNVKIEDICKESNVSVGAFYHHMKNKAGIIVAGSNYGQGSSREHAALAPRHLGIRAVLALSFARIHRANLVNFGILPFIIKNIEDYERFCLGDEVQIDLQNLDSSSEVIANVSRNGKIEKIIMMHNLSANELRQLTAGGLLNDVRNRKNS